MQDKVADAASVDTEQDSGDTLVRLEHVCVAVGAHRILDDVSLSIGRGAPTLLLGPNGAGKTTLIKLVMGLVEPTAGTISEAGRGGPALVKSLVFQRPVMLRRSAAANVAFALKAAGRGAGPSLVEDLLVRVRLGGFGARPARHLSAGEQQRLALARALAREPALLLLDEPTASLDPAATKVVEEIVREVATGGVKVVMATHDLGQARRLAGDIVLLAGGKLVEHANAAQFFKLPATVEGRRFLAGDLIV